MPYLGGTEKHVYEVSKRLAEKHDVTVLTARMPGTKKEEVIDGIKIIRNPAIIIKKAPHPLPPPFPITVDTFLQIRSQAQKNDIVHFHNRFTYSLIDFGVVKKAKSKLCMTLHNSKPQGIDQWTDLVGGTYDKFIGNPMMKMADKIAGVSMDTLKETVPKSMWEKTQVIYNGVNLEQYDPSIDGTPMEKKYGKYFFCVARLIEQKGLSYLINAMKDVDANLVIVGKGPLEKKLKTQAKKQGKKITLLAERIPEHELAQLYKGSYGYVIPSLYEPFGMVVCEAMALERPVIGTNIGGIPEIITKDTGLLVKLRDSKALAEKMTYLLDNPQEAEKMGKAGRKRVENNFTWDHTTQAYEKFYKEFQK